MSTTTNTTVTSALSSLQQNLVKLDNKYKTKITTNTDSITALDSKLSTLLSAALKRLVVDELPAGTDADLQTIYMIANDSDDTSNVYDEYMFFNDIHSYSGTISQTTFTTSDTSGFVVATDGTTVNFSNAISATNALLKLINLDADYTATFTTCFNTDGINEVTVVLPLSGSVESIVYLRDELVGACAEEGSEAYLKITACSAFDSGTAIEITSQVLSKSIRFEVIGSTAVDISNKMDKFGVVELDGTRLGDVTASVKNFQLLNLTGESGLGLGNYEASLHSKGRTVISRLNAETGDSTEVAVSDGVVTLSKAGKIDVILNGVATPTDDNHGANKQYVDEAVAEALSGYVMAEVGKGLSTNDFTDDDKKQVDNSIKIAGISNGELSFEMNAGVYNIKAFTKITFRTYASSSDGMTTMGSTKLGSTSTDTFLFVSFINTTPSYQIKEFRLLGGNRETVYRITRATNAATGEYTDTLTDETPKVDQTYTPTSPNAQSGKAVAEAMSNKMDKTNPTGTGSFSLNRKADTAVGNYSFAEGFDTNASGYASHAEGYNTTASGDYSHAEGEGTTASGKSSHAEGFYTTASGYASHAEGNDTTASSGMSHAEGYSTTSSGNYSHAEGYNTTASGYASHAEGDNTLAGQMGFAVTACEKLTNTTGTYTLSSVIGLKRNQRYSVHLSSSQENCGQITAIDTKNKKITVNGYPNIALSTNTSSITNYLTIVGRPILGDITISGYNSHAEGQNTTALGDHQHVQGKYNIEDSNNTYADIIGNGSYDEIDEIETRSNAATVDWQGNAWYAGAVTSNGADYAEFFEWLDGNPNNEDRVGYLVALDGEKIRFANSEDEILGIISANPAILGDNYECNWNGKYLTDEFGRILYDKVEEFIDIPKVDEETGETTIEKKSLGFFDHPRINPDYDPDQEYINRRNRSEWAIVGMLGKLFVRDDGTAQINGYVSTGEGGIATASTEKTNMRVLSRVNDHIVKVLLK